MTTHGRGVVEEALGHLERGVRLEERGERGSLVDLNDAAAAYRTACRLLESYLADADNNNNNNVSAAKRALLEDKIAHYRERTRSLSRDVRARGAQQQQHQQGGPLAAELVDDASAAVPPPRFLLHTQDSLESCCPLPVAVPVPHYDEDHPDKDPPQERSGYGALKAKCEGADAAIEEAVRLDNDRNTDAARRAYEEGAGLSLEAVRLAESLLHHNKDTVITAQGEDQLRRFCDYLKERLVKVLDRLEQLQKEEAEPVHDTSSVNLKSLRSSLPTLSFSGLSLRK